ncbi:hypothetical protein [Lactobacillus johnsonii]|jgi:hypothetical protein|uniref:Uncharacterized protein n=1 Tax=Lactobacillus johnsonii TaxID=33959 RepID=A0A9X7XV08_LACJH|nr:hypothetical protein [Lactobacillus johnsonii]QIA88667.1 hypothetical protein FEE39_10520 [Lactobacillus johnsonii]
MTKKDVYVIEQSKILTALQKLNKEAYEKRKLAPVTEFDDDDWRMAWLVALIEDKLKDRAQQGHHEMKLVLFKQIFPFLGCDYVEGRNYSLDDPQFIVMCNNALITGNTIDTSINKRICDLATEIHLNKNIFEYGFLGHLKISPKYRQKTIDSYIRLRYLAITLSPEQAVKLERYICIKFKPVLLKCKVVSVTDKRYSWTDLNITFAW